MSNLFDPSTEIFTSLYKFLKNASLDKRHLKSLQNIDKVFLPF